MGTPPRPNFALPRMLATDTPMKSKHSLTSPAILDGLEVGRKAVMRDIGDVIPLVSIEYFQSALLPPLREAFFLDDIVDRLAQDGHIEARVVSGKAERRWKYFPDDPAKLRELENVVFKDFATLASAVSKTGEDILKQWSDKQPARADRILPDVRPTALFQCNPDIAPLSTQRESTSRPDSFARLNPFTPVARHSITKKIAWDDIVVAGEFKKEHTVKAINDVSPSPSATASH